MTPAGRGPLSDLVVVEAAADVAGAFCGKCFADLGARVIKVEPPGGDPLRSAGPFAGGEQHPEKGALFLWLNTGKESVTIDLAAPAGRDLFDALAARANLVIVSPFDVCGVDVATLAERNPAGVVLAISPFGLEGPHAAWRADDLVRCAMGGWMHMTGRPDREPLTSFETLPSAITGLAAASAGLMALHAARASGRGQVVDVSSQEVLILCTAYSVLAYSYTGIQRPRSGMPFPMTIVPAADGYLGINVLAQAQWEALCAFTGMADLLDNPEYATPLARAGHARELTERFAAWAAGRAKVEVFHEGQGWRIPFGYVPSLGEVFSLPPHEARHFFHEVEHPAAGTVWLPRVPFLVEGWAPPGPPPLLGEHTSAVVAELSDSTEANDDA